MRRALSRRGRGVEIGVGGGRFAEPLGITVGVDPSVGMGAVARSRGIDVVCGVAEELPFVDGSFDCALMVTVLLFLDDPGASIDEVSRVLRGGGIFVLAFIDRRSLLARHYAMRRDERDSSFRDARFYGVGEVERFLRNGGFRRLAFFQTIFHLPDEFGEVEPVREGYGRGSFVVVRAIKG